MESKQPTTKENLIDWLVYTFFTLIVTTPFLGGEWLKHICASLLISFFFGMMNRIIRELTILNEKS